jgi:hypothetical protein
MAIRVISILVIPGRTRTFARENPESHHVRLDQIPVSHPARAGRAPE